MTRAEVLFFLNSLSRLVLDGNTHAAAHRFNIPLAIYSPQRLLVAKSYDEMVGRLSMHCAQCRSLNVTRVQVNNLAIKDCTGNRALVAADMLYLDRTGTMQRFSSQSYVLRRTGTSGDLRIELVDYAIPGFPELSQQQFHPA